MTDLTFSISPEEQWKFERSYYSELAQRWAPFRGYSLTRATFAILAAALFFLAIPGVERAFGMLAGAFFLFWGFQAAIEKITTASYLRYLSVHPGIERYHVFFEGDFLYVEQRGVRRGFPVARASKPYRDKVYLYVDFPDLGRVRIPLSAFPDGHARLAFEKYVIEKIGAPPLDAEASKKTVDARRKPSACPQCGYKVVKRIIYGNPSAESLLRIETGEACMAPDFVRPWLPDWHCAGCGHEWFLADDPGKQQHEKFIQDMLEKTPRKST